MRRFNRSTTILGRRAFLRSGSLVLAATTLDKLAPSTVIADGESTEQVIRFALVTDLHYADKPPARSRHYRETPAKLAEAAERFARDRPEFLVELGDLIDSADSVEAELGYLRRINEDISRISKRRHYVLGNHCVFTLTKEEFLGAVGQERSYYSFDFGGHHFVVLDSCYRSDGKPYGRKNAEWTDCHVPSDELQWLEADLSGTPNKTIVFVHQRLDVGSPYGVKNAPEVRKVLEGSRKVLAVFQGHSHKNDYHDVSGIHYVTLVAMVEGSGAENNGYAIAELDRSDSIRVHGFRQQKDYEWRA